jgi:hypothetical protein
MTPLKSLAGISVPESSMLVIQPYDKGSIPAIEKAIQQSDLGLTPNNDGNVIRLNVPQLTQVMPGLGYVDHPPNPEGICFLNMAGGYKRNDLPEREMAFLSCLALLLPSLHSLPRSRLMIIPIWV